MVSTVKPNIQPSTSSAFQGELKQPTGQTLTVRGAAHAVVNWKANIISVNTTAGVYDLALGRAQGAWPLTVNVDLLEDGVKVDVMFTNGAKRSQTIYFATIGPPVPPPQPAPRMLTLPKATVYGPSLEYQAEQLNRGYAAINERSSRTDYHLTTRELGAVKAEIRRKYAKLDAQRITLLSAYANEDRTPPWALSKDEWFFSGGRQQAAEAVDKLVRSKWTDPGDYSWGP